MLRALIPPKGKLIPFFKIHFSNNKKGRKDKKGGGKGWGWAGEHCPAGVAPLPGKRPNVPGCPSLGSNPSPRSEGWLLSAGARSSARTTSEVHLPGATKERNVSGLKGGRSPASEVSADTWTGEGKEGKVPITQGPKLLPSLLLGPRQRQPPARCRDSSLAFSFEHQPPGSPSQGRASSPGPAQGRASHRRTARQLLSLCRRTAEGRSFGRNVLLRFSLFSPFLGGGRSCRRHGGIAARGSGRFPFFAVWCGIWEQPKRQPKGRTGISPPSKGTQGHHQPVCAANLSAWARCLRGAGG